jgi:hypothetical protein
VFVLSGTGLCDGPIPRPEESYRLWCLYECDKVQMKTLDTCCEQVGRRGKDYLNIFFNSVIFLQLIVFLRSIPRLHIASYSKMFLSVTE